MNYLEEHFKIFNGAASRRRWFLLATALISSIMFIHIYLESGSYTKNSLTKAIENRYKSGITDSSLVANLKSDVSLLSSASGRTDSIDLFTKIASAAEQIYAFRRTNLSLNSEVGLYRGLPFIDLKIPSNDFLPVISIILTLFFFGVRMNTATVRGIVASLLSEFSTPKAGGKMTKDSEQVGDTMTLDRLKSLIYAHYVFTGKSLTARKDNKLPKTEYASYWLPFVTIFLATFIDAYPLFDQREFVFGDLEHLIIRYVILGTCGFLVFWIASSCTSIANETNELVSAQTND